MTGSLPLSQALQQNPRPHRMSGWISGRAAFLFVGNVNATQDYSKPAFFRTAMKFASLWGYGTRSTNFPSRSNTTVKGIP